MTTQLKTLMVEDSPDDTDLILSELRRAGFDPQWKRVESEEDFLAEIEKLPDIILSDYSMPRFTGLRAAKLLRESGLNIPFILVSGTVGEESRRCLATASRRFSGKLAALGQRRCG